MGGGPRAREHLIDVEHAQTTSAGKVPGAVIVEDVSVDDDDEID